MLLQDDPAYKEYMYNKEKEWHKPSFLEGLHKEAKELLFQFPQSLYLTGSRFFKTDDVYSDWDFFTKQTMEARVWLRRRGFNQLLDGEVYTLDSVTNRVYRKTLVGPPFMEWNRAQIDIQFVTDVDLKIIAQNYLKYMGVFKYHPDNSSKLIRKILWDRTYSLIRRKEHYLFTR